MAKKSSVKTDLSKVITQIISWDDSTDVKEENRLVKVDHRINVPIGKTITYSHYDSIPRDGEPFYKTIYSYKFENNTANSTSPAFTYLNNEGRGDFVVGTPHLIEASVETAPSGGTVSTVTDLAY